MNERPVQVSVVAWIILITGGMSLVMTPLTLKNPAAQEMMAASVIPIPLQVASMVIGLVVSIVSGICMLRGANWARLLYIGWGAIGIVVGLLTSPNKAMVVPGGVAYAAFVFFLTRPVANAFFKQTPNVPSA